MAPKKKQDEVIDLSTLPTINTITSSLLLDFNWQDRRFKLLELLYKSTQKNLRFVTRDQLIDFAKEKGIFVDDTDYKKNPNLEKKEPNPEEFAKAYKALVIDRSIPIMKDKQVVIERIEELKKIKDELINKLNNPEVVDPKKKNNNTDTKKKVEFTNPDEIYIPENNEYETNLIVCFLNYPINADEFKALDKQNLTISNITLIKDMNPFVEIVEEIDPKDPKKKNQPPKQEKVSQDVQNMQKLFAPYKNTNYSELYNILNYEKMVSPSISKLRNTFMETLQFRYSINEESKSDNIQSFLDIYLSNLDIQCKFFVNFEKWELSKNSLQPLSLKSLYEYILKKLEFLNKGKQNLNNSAINHSENENKNNKDSKVKDNKEVKDKDKSKNDKSNIKDITKDNKDTSKDVKNTIAVEDDISVVKYKIEDFLTKEQLSLISSLENRELNHSSKVIFNSINKTVSYNNINLENISLGLQLFILSREIVTFYRDQYSHGNKINNEKVDNELDYLFFDLEKQLEYNYSSNLVNLDSNSHIGIHNTDVGDKIEKNMKNDMNDHSSAFRLIVDYDDQILKKNLENKIDTELVAEKEKMLGLFSELPGINRYLMETPPLKEEHYRKALKCEVYPFLKNIPTSIYEKFMNIYAFELMGKALYPEREDIDFGNRKYVHIMNRDILTQVLSKFDLYDMEVASKYNDRDDSLMLFGYYRNPKGRIYHRMSKQRYLSKPEFQNWISNFKPTPIYPVIDEKDLEKEAKEKEIKDKNNKDKDKKQPPKDKNVQPEFTKPDANTVIGIELKEDLPETNTLYLADDNKVGELVEKIKYMFPNDNGIMIRKVLLQGNYKVHHNYVIKDNLVFGINKNTQGFNEIWINFDNNVKMNSVYIPEYQNSYNEIFKEEIEFIKQENLNKLFSGGNNNQNDKRENTNVSNKDDLNMNENTLDNLTNQLNSHNNNANDFKNTNKKRDFYFEIQKSANSQKGVITSFNFPNGLEVQILANGDILQRYHRLVNELDDNEVSRIYCSKGSVIKQTRLGITKILYSNGNTCTIKNNISFNTNNKGFVLQKNYNNGQVKQLESVPVTIQSDPETNTKTLVRNDKTMIIKYIDNSLLTIHEDNTKMFTYPSKNHFIIENDEYASVEIRLDPRKKMMKTEIKEGSIDALLGEDDIILRSYDGELKKVILPDRTEVFTWKEKKATEEFEKATFNTIVLVIRPDGAVIKIQQDGDVALISSNERQLMAMKSSQNQEKGNFSNRTDNDYFFEIFGKSDERKGGVYSLDLKKGVLWTSDRERNIFELNVNGIAKEKLNASLDLDMTLKKIDEIQPKSPKKNEYVPFKQNIPNFDFNVKMLYNDNPVEVEAISLADNPINTGNKKTVNAKKNVTNSISSNNTNTNNANVNSNSKNVIANNVANHQGNSNSITNTINANPNSNANNLNNSKLAEDYMESKVNIFEFEYKDPNSIVLKVPENLYNPRLILINNNNTGYELLCDDQISLFRQTHTPQSLNINNNTSNTLNDKEKTKTKYNYTVNDQHEINNGLTTFNISGDYTYPNIFCKYFNDNYNSEFISHYWLEKYFSNEELISYTHRIKNIKIPKSLEKIVSSPLQRKYPIKENYLYKNILEHQHFDEDFRKEIINAIKARDDYLGSKLKDFGMFHQKNPIIVDDEIKRKNRHVQMRILNERQTEDLKFIYEELRDCLNYPDLLNILLPEKSIVYDLEAHVIEKNNRIIIENSDLRKMPLDLDNVDLNSLLQSIKEIKDKPKKYKNKFKRLDANAEVKFIPNYFLTEEGEKYYQLNPRDRDKSNIKRKRYNNALQNPNKISSNTNNVSHSMGDSNVENDRNDRKQTGLISHDNKMSYEKNPFTKNDGGKNVIDEHNNENDIEEEYKEKDHFANLENESDNKMDNNQYEIGNVLDVNKKSSNFSLDEKVNKITSSTVELDKFTEETNDLLSNPKKFLRTMSKKHNLPSFYKQQISTIKRLEEKEKQDSEKWYESKKYKYSVIPTNVRQNLPDLPYLKTTFPEANFNEDYIYIEKMTDPRIKTSSVANRLYFNAPSINDIRKQGQHDFLIQAIDEKRTYDEMMEKLNLMITSELCDPMNKHLKIDPVKIYLGNLIYGGKYQAYIHIRNDDNMTTRVQVIKEKPESKALNLEMFIGGSVSKFNLDFTRNF